VTTKERLRESDLETVLQAARQGSTSHYETGAKLGWTRQRISRVAKKFGAIEHIKTIYEQNKAGRRGELTGEVETPFVPASLEVSSEAIERDVTTAEGRKNVNLELQVKDLKKEVKKLRLALLDQENLVERVVIASTTPLPKPEFKVRASTSKKPERAVLLPIFDQQYGARVIPEDTVGGIGGFDSSIFAERVRLYVEKCARIMRAYAVEHTLTQIVFAIGGDTVEGDEIFGGMEWQLEMPPPDQVMGMRDHLSWIVDALMEVGASLGIKKASVLCVPGNHGKRGGKKAGARHKSDSWDVMVYRLLEERLKNYPIFNFAIEPAGNCTFDVLGNIFGMIHGDEVKGWGGLPFYGLTRHDAKMIRTLNVIPEYVLLGHHHQPASIPIGYGEHLMSGNWVGASNLSNVVGSNTPQQWLFFVDRDYGVCTREPIYLDERRKPQPTIHQTA
jgi:hypothetical protein